MADDEELLELIGSEVFEPLGADLRKTAYLLFNARRTQRITAGRGRASSWTVEIPCGSDGDAKRLRCFTNPFGVQVVPI